MIAEVLIMEASNSCNDNYDENDKCRDKVRVAVISLSLSVLIIMITQKQDNNQNAYRRDDE